MRSLWFTDSLTSRQVAINAPTFLLELSHWFLRAAQQLLWARNTGKRIYPKMKWCSLCQYMYVRTITIYICIYIAQLTNFLEKDEE